MTAQRTQIARYAAIFAGGTMLSRLTGFVRDMVVAAVVPAAARDAFLFAFSVGNMLRDILGEGATNAAFVPVLSAAAAKESPADYRRAVAACFGGMLLLLTIVTAAGVLLMPFVPALLALVQPLTGRPLAPPAQLEHLVALLQWTFPYLWFIGLAAFASAPLFVARRYGTPSWSPVLLNVSFVIACFGLPRWLGGPEWALVAATWLGGALQLAVMVWAMRRHAGVLWPRFALAHPAMRKSLRLLGPVVFGQAAGEVNKLAGNAFALMLGPGVVSALFFANRLVQLPLSIFGVATSVAVLPEISRAVAQDDAPRARATLMHGLLQTTFLVLPATAGLLLLAEPIVRLLFERGAFDAAQTAQTTLALWCYALGLPAFAWVKVCVQGFYARHDTVTPVAVSAFSMLLNIALSAALVGSAGLRGLALATTLAYAANAALLYLLLGRRYGALFDAPFARGLARIAAATAAMSAAIYAAARGAAALPIPPGALDDALAVALPMAAAAAAYAVAARALRVAELDDFLALLRRRRGAAQAADQAR